VTASCIAFSSGLSIHTLCPCMNKMLLAPCQGLLYRGLGMLVHLPIHTLQPQHCLQVFEFITEHFKLLQQRAMNENLNKCG